MKNKILKKQNKMNNVQIFLAMCYMTLVFSIFFGILHSLFTYIMEWGERRDKEIESVADKKCAKYIKLVEARSGNTRFLIEGTDEVDMNAVNQYLSIQESRKVKKQRKAVQSIAFEVVK